MKINRITFLAVICAIFFMPQIVMPIFAQPERSTIPRVTYVSPDDEETVDLTGKDNLVFRWNGAPTPGGGRIAYRFRVYKGFGYEVVAGQDLRPDIFSIEVPAEKFNDGQVYSWHVQQRDGANMGWSLYDNWSFKVIKK